MTGGPVDRSGADPRRPADPVIGIRRRAPEPAIGLHDELAALDEPRRRPRLRVLVALAIVLLAALLAAAYFWVRGSSLSAVRDVRVTGLSGPEAGQVRGALETAARSMSTLDVNHAAFHDAVAAYPEVKSVTATASFPHSMTIHVVEQNPVAIVVAGSHRTVVSGDGTLLPNVKPTTRLPTIALRVAPAGSKLSGAPRREAAVLARAPSALLARVASASEDPTHGLTVSLRDGPQLYFGGAHRLAAKWSSVVAVLATSSSAGAAYIDVTDPSRPAAGGTGS
jgi:cell division protein FtsQ